MPISVSGLLGEIDTLINDLASQATGVDFGDLPLVGNILAPAEGLLFAALQDKLTAALDGVADDATAIAAALDAVEGVTAVVNGAGGIDITIADRSGVGLTPTNFDIGGEVGPVGLKLGGTVATEFVTDLNIALRVDAGTGQVSIVDGGTPELKVGFDADLSLDAGASLGIVDITAKDADPDKPELSVFATLDLPTGDAGNLGGDIAFTIDGRAGLDLKIVTSNIAGILPSISTNLVIDYTLGDASPAIAFNNITINVGEMFGVFQDVFEAVNTILDTKPMGTLLDLTTGPVPIVNDLANSTGAVAALDVLPTFARDGIVSLVDLALLKESLLNASGTTPNQQSSAAFYEGLSTLGFIRTLSGQVAAGEINLGNIAFGGDPTNPEKIFTSLVGETGLGELDSIMSDVFGDIDVVGDAFATIRDNLAESFSENSGLEIPLLDDPSKIIELLFNNSNPFVLAEFTLPYLKVAEKAEALVGAFGIGLLFFGKVDIKAGFSIGYDTAGLVSGNFAQGFLWQPRNRPAPLPDSSRSLAFSPNWAQEERCGPLC